MADKKQINPRRPIPNSGYDRLRTNLQANFRNDFPITIAPIPVSNTLLAFPLVILSVVG